MKTDDLNYKLILFFQHFFNLGKHFYDSSFTFDGIHSLTLRPSVPTCPCMLSRRRDIGCIYGGMDVGVERKHGRERGSGGREES